VCTLQRCQTTRFPTTLSITTLVSTETTEGVNKSVNLTSSAQKQQGENLGTNASDKEIHLAVRQK
jgi:hypothetical protein